VAKTSRRIVIQFIVTAREKRTIQAAAKRAGVSVSQFIRNATCSNAQTQQWERRA
jgi:uncharacterized protein (DUF1778 family)